MFLSFGVGAHGWVAGAVVPVRGALFLSRGWLPIVDAPGYFRHSTSILAMQLLTADSQLLLRCKHSRFSHAVFYAKIEHIYVVPTWLKKILHF